MSQKEWASMPHPEEAPEQPLQVELSSLGRGESESGESKLDDRQVIPEKKRRFSGPVLREMILMGLSKNDLKRAALDAENDTLPKDTIYDCYLRKYAEKYRGRQIEFYRRWRDLTCVMEKQGFVVQIGDWAARLTEEGKEWLNRPAGGFGADEVVGVQTISRGEAATVLENN